ncbi:MAG: hypothetical protein R8J85_02885 [Mariprofundales bacterium]
MSNPSTARRVMAAGFSLVEVMMATFIASAGVLAISQGTIATINANSVARERIAATNLALDVIESWQASSSDSLPNLACANGSVLLETGSPSGIQSSCVLLSKEVNVSYTITIKEHTMQAPLPPISGTIAMSDLYAGLRITALLVDRNTASTLYAGTNGYGLFTSTDSGASWSKIDAFGYSKVNNIIQLPGTGHVFIAATDSYTMTNNGLGGAWQQRTGTAPDSLPNTNILSIATDPYGILYAGSDNYTSTNNGGVYKSTDGALNWSPANGTVAVVSSSVDTYTVNAMVFDSYVFAGTNGGAYFSTDDGYSWSAATTQPGNTVIYALATPGSSNTIYAGTGSNLYKSIDKGATWTSEGLSANPFRALVIAPSDGTLYAGSTIGVYHAAPASSLSTSGLGFKADIRTYSVAVDPTASTIVYAGSDSGLFKSTNSGGTWARSDTGIGMIPKEKVVSISWTHKSTNYHVTLTHVTQRSY